MRRSLVKSLVAIALLVSLAIPFKSSAEELSKMQKENQKLENLVASYVVDKGEPVSPLEEQDKRYLFREDYKTIYVGYNKENLVEFRATGNFEPLGRIEVYALADEKLMDYSIGAIDGPNDHVSFYKNDKNHQAVKGEEGEKVLNKFLKYLVNKFGIKR